MSINSFQEKFQHALGDMYDAEHQFLDVQRQMLAEAHATELKTLLKNHNEQTTGHIANLEKAFKLLGLTPKRQPCDAARGLVTEWQQMAKETGTPEIADWVIASAQAKVEHYEIASYRGLIIGAQVMKNDPVVQLLRQNLRQEEQTAATVQSEPRELEETLAERAVDAQ